MNHRTPTARHAVRALALAWALGLAAVCARAQEGSGTVKAAERARARPAVTLADVRDLFTRVDADRDGLLDVREADHGGIDAARLRGFDHDGDGHLSREEFVVAKRQVLARSGRPLAADLEAESTRVQALWRVRRDQAGRGERRGPSSRVRSTPPRGSVGEVPAPATPEVRRAGGVARTEGAPVPSPGTARTSSPPQLTPGAGGPGLGLERLRRASGEAGRPPATVEDGARAAQRLLEQRLVQRQARSAPAPAPRSSNPAPAPGSGGPGERARGERPLKPTTGTRPKPPDAATRRAQPEKPSGGPPAPPPPESSSEKPGASTGEKPADATGSKKTGGGRPASGAQRP